MKRKTKTGNLMLEYAKDIRKQLTIYNNIRQSGYYDPAWSEKANLPTIRTHIEFVKDRMRDIQRKYGIPFPKEYYIPTPEIK